MLAAEQFDMAEQAHACIRQRMTSAQVATAQKRSHELKDREVTVY